MPAKQPPKRPATENRLPWWGWVIIIAVVGGVILKFALI